ncbi:hypothetical protein HK097_002488 [Rhizophlyctis rosea]|uniref:RRM domain-containing protein n=1 Tax=Rhizophlyctis rosea TaxID=64517 RepID=A0AAD5SGF9_9FUNG|nr:hypothetical protein HK097_002488 [Rhizophlyctis rosea]
MTTSATYDSGLSLPASASGTTYKVPAHNGRVAAITFISRDLTENCCENIRCLLNHLGECGEVLGFKTGCGPNGNYIVVEFKTEEAAWECLTKPVFCCKGWCMKIRPARIPSEVSQIETFDRSTKSPQTPVPKEKSAKRRRRSRSPSDTTPDRTSKSEHKRHRSSHHRSKRQSTRRGRSPSPDPAPSSSNQRDDPEASSVVVVKEKTTQDAPTPRRKENAASPPPPERATNGPNPVTAAEGTQPAAAAGTHPKSDQQGPILPTSTWPAITSDYLEQFLSSILRQQPNHTGSDQEVMDLTTPELSPPHVNGQTKQPLVYHTDANGQLPYAPAHPDVKVENNEHPSADISSGSTDVDAKDIAERPPFSRNASISLSAFEETLQDMADEGDKSGFVGLKARFCFGCGWKFVSGDRFCALCGKDRRVFES